MLRRFAAATRAALSPSAIRAAMADGMEMGRTMGAVMPNGRQVHQARRPPAEAPVPEAEAAVARAAARTPYRALGPAVAIDRFVAPAGDAGLAVLSLAGVAERTHEVWGCSPSAAVVQPSALPPDALGPIALPWVEWTVVHAAGPALTTALAEAAAAVTAGGGAPSYVDVVQLDRAARWLDRPRSDPLPWDEDLAALVVRDVDPAWCLGVHRVLSWGAFGPPGQRSVMVEPTGVRVLGRADAGLRAGRAALVGAAPVRSLAADADGPVRVAVLDPSLRPLLEPYPWTAPPPVVTTHPDLPVDADELLVAYLEIVGIDPGDTYGVALTVREQQSATVAADAGDRGDAASLVTVVHRDREAYAEGRERFARWSAEAVGTTLVDQREPVDAVQRWGNRALKVKNVDTMGLGTFRDQGVGQAQDVAFYPYCAGPRPS